MEISGKIIAVLPVKTGISKASGKTWMQQDFVVETIEEYPHRAVLGMFGEDRIAEAAIRVGDEVNVKFDIDAREYQGRWYNDLRAWKIEKTAAQPEEPQYNEPEPPKDDLPF